MASELKGLRVAFLTSDEGVEQVELTAFRGPQSPGSVPSCAEAGGRAAGPVRPGPAPAETGSALGACLLSCGRSPGPSGIARTDWTASFGSGQYSSARMGGSRQGCS